MFTVMVYYKAVQTIYSIIRRAVLSTICKSQTATSLRLDKSIIIYENDWDDLADVVKAALENPSSDERSELPAAYRVFFVIKKFGKITEQLKATIYYYLKPKSDVLIIRYVKRTRPRLPETSTNAIPNVPSPNGKKDSGTHCVRQMCP